MRAKTQKMRKLMVFLAVFAAFSLVFTPVVFAGNGIEDQLPEIVPGGDGGAGGDAGDDQLWDGVPDGTVSGEGDPLPQGDGTDGAGNDTTPPDVITGPEEEEVDQAGELEDLNIMLSPVEVLEEGNPGAIFTTDQKGKRENHFQTGDRVYLEGQQFPESVSKLYYRIAFPDERDKPIVEGQITDLKNGEFAGVKIWTIPEDAELGVYAVMVSADENNWAPGHTKNDNFHVSAGKNCQAYSISGKLWNDTNNNKRLDGGEEGLAGWTVKLYKKYLWWEILKGELTTDSRGEYKFEKLPKNILSAYLVKVTPEEGWVNTYPGKNERTVKITNNNLTNINFGYWKNEVIPQTYIISGTVWKNVRNCDDENGEAAVNWAAVLKQGGEQVDETTTDANGEYEFYGLAAGSYTVEVNPPAGEGWVNTCPGTGDTRDVVITDDDVTGVDFGYWRDNEPPATYSIYGFVWRDSDKDGVLDAGESGLHNWTVKLKVYNEQEEGGYVVLATTTTNSGAYSFASLASGEYHVEVLPPAGQGWQNTYPGENFRVVGVPGEGRYSVDFGYWKKSGSGSHKDQDSGTQETTVEVPLPEPEAGPETTPVEHTSTEVPLTDLEIPLPAPESGPAELPRTGANYAYSAAAGIALLGFGVALSLRRKRVTN